MTNETTGYTIEIDGPITLMPYPEKLYVGDDVQDSPHLKGLREGRIRDLLGIKPNDDDFDDVDDYRNILLYNKPNAWRYFSKILERPYSSQKDQIERPNYKPGDIFRADLTFYLTDYPAYLKNHSIYEQSKYWADQWENRTSELYDIINMFKQACSNEGHNIDVTNVYYLLSVTEELDNLNVLNDESYQTVENDVYYYNRRLGKYEKILSRNYIQHIRIYFKTLDFDDDTIITDGYKITEGFNGRGGIHGMASRTDAGRNQYWTNYDGPEGINWAIKPENDEYKSEVKINYDSVDYYQSTVDQEFVYSLSTIPISSNIYRKIEDKRVSINGKNGASIYTNQPQDIYINDGTKYLDNGVFDFFCECTSANSASIFAEFSPYQVPFNAGGTSNTSTATEETRTDIEGTKWVKWHFSNLIFDPEIDNKYQKEIYAYCPEADLESNINYATVGKMTVKMEDQNIGRYNLNVMDTLRRYGH